MKKKLIALSAAVVLAFAPSAAQSIPEVAPGMHSGDSLTMLVDSLRRELRARDYSREAFEKEALNNKIWDGRSKYFNISYVNQTLTLKNAGLKWRSDYGVALTNGRTYYLHKKPLLGMIKFGLDLSMGDVSFAKYDDNNGLFVDRDSYVDNGDGVHTGEPGDDGEEGDDAETMYQLEAGIAIGPSVTVNPVDELKAAVYFRVMPSVSMLYAGSEFCTSYGTFFSLGGSVAWKAISLGMEWRWGSVKYDSLFDDYAADDGFDDDDPASSYEFPSDKWKVSSMRVYLSLRF